MLYTLSSAFGGLNVFVYRWSYPQKNAASPRATQCWTVVTFMPRVSKQNTIHPEVDMKCSRALTTGPQLARPAKIPPVKVAAVLDSMFLRLHETDNAFEYSGHTWVTLFKLETSIQGVIMFHGR